MYLYNLISNNKSLYAYNYWQNGSQFLSTKAYLKIVLHTVNMHGEKDQFKSFLKVNAFMKLISEHQTNLHAICMEQEGCQVILFYKGLISFWLQTNDDFDMNHKMIPHFVLTQSIHIVLYFIKEVANLGLQ